MEKVRKGAGPESLNLVGVSLKERDPTTLESFTSQHS